MWRFLRNRYFPTNCGRDSVIGRKMSRGESREFGGFPTKQFARGCFVGVSGQFCAENSGIFRQNRSCESGLSELAGGFALRTLGFSDKTVCTGSFCRNESALLCRELWDFPTKQVARRRFVGMGGRFCAGNPVIL